MIRALLPVALLIVALPGCGPKLAPEPSTEAYLIVPSASDDAGWEVVEALGTELPEEDRRRIGVPSLVSEQSSDMLIPFTGSCEADAAFVARVEAIARRHGARGSRCSPTIPA